MNDRWPPFPEVTHVVTAESIREYAELSGDFNPLHVDPEYAAATRFGSVVAHGPLGLQTAFEMMTSWLGLDALPAVSVEAAYLAPVRPGDAVTSRVTGILEHAGALALTVACTNQRGEAVIEALVTVPRHLVPRVAA
jgi:phosphate acetyltransferase/phosphate butyryltransferase